METYNDENKIFDTPPEDIVNDVIPESEQGLASFDIPISTTNTFATSQSRPRQREQLGQTTDSESHTNVLSWNLNSLSEHNSPFFSPNSDFSNFSATPVSQIPTSIKSTTRRERPKFDVFKSIKIKEEQEEVKIDSDDKDHFVLFENWLIDNGAKFPDIYLKNYSSDVRGVHAQNHINCYSTILFVPLTCLITDKMGRECELGKKIFNNSSDVHLSTPNLIAVILYILETKDQEDHFFNPYYKILPKSYSNFPIFWTEDKLSWLQGSPLLKDIEDRKQNMKNDYKELLRIYPAFAQYSYEEFLQVRTAVGSRNFGVTIKGEKRTAMVPFADMLNHYRPRETSWTYDNTKEGFTITSLTPICPDEQVMDSYGKKCNSKFFLHYGFAVDNNREDNGRCQNEISLKFRYLKFNNSATCERETQDKKLYVLSSLFSLGIKNNFEVSKVAKLSMNFDDNTTTEIFAFLRIKHATTNELSLIFNQDRQRHIPGLYFARSRDVAILPISFLNELKALEDMAHICRQQLTKYELNYSENKELLNSGKFKPFSDRRTALIVVLGEQEICQFWIKTYELLKPLLLNQDIEGLKNLTQVNNDEEETDRARYANYLAKKLKDVRF